MAKKNTVHDKNRKRNARKKTVKTVAGVFFVLALSIALAVLIIWKVFTVKEVEVKGNEHYSKEQIEKIVLRDEYAWNSLYVYLKYKFTQTTSIPFVDTVEVKLQTPQKLSIQVYEKAILGYLYIPSIDQNAYFDKDGFVVETSKKKIEGIPKVEGLECEQVVLYEKLPIKSEKILKSLLIATQALKKQEVVPDAIMFEENGDISLSYDKRILVILGSSENLTKKILRLPYVLPELEGMKGTLHVENWTENTRDIIFDKEK